MVLFSLRRRPAQRLSIGVIFTALSLRLIRWKRRGSGMASRLRARRRQSEQKEQRETSRRRIFVTREQTEGSHYRVGGVKHARDLQARKPARRIRQYRLRLSRKEDSFLFSPRLSGQRTLLWPAGACASRFSSTSDGVARNAFSRPFHGQ